MSSQITTSKGIVTVRPAVTSDAELLRDLRLEALARHPEAFAADYAKTEADPAERWVEYITGYASSNSGVICVASADDRLIGMMGLTRGHHPKTRHRAEIWGVYVNADWRGFRVGDALLNECIAWAKAQGIITVNLGVVTTNTSAIRCYARCGFTIYGIDPKIIYHDGIYYDELLMTKSI